MESTTKVTSSQDSAASIKDEKERNDDIQNQLERTNNNIDDGNANGSGRDNKPPAVSSSSSRLRHSLLRNEVKDLQIPGCSNISRKRRHFEESNNNNKGENSVGDNNPNKDDNNNDNDDNGEDNTTEPPLPPHHAPVIANGVVEFSLAAVHKHLICQLCHGYYKDPYTIKECLHTFCKSCLFYAVACGCHECPTCHVYVGNDPAKVAILDRTLQDLVDRIIFPNLKEEERQEEEAFYQARGIARKKDFSPKRNMRIIKNNKKQSPINHHRQKPPELELTVLPAEVDEKFMLPALDCPYLRISGSFRMNQLKKYIVHKLSLPSGSRVDILCNGVPLGDEISLTFVHRLLWHEEDADLTLSYRRAADV